MIHITDVSTIITDLDRFSTSALIIYVNSDINNLRWKQCAVLTR